MMVPASSAHPLGSTGADETINATALTSYRVDHDPTSRTYVHDNFGQRRLQPCQ